MLRRGGSIKAILDLLGTFEPERLLAIYFALPEDRRKIVRRGDGVWAYRIERAPEGIEEAGFFLEDMNVTDPEPVPQELADFRRERRRFLAGLPHELSPNEMAMGLRV
ncbi:MAG: hypothetical protein HYX29_01255 [Solirubrobacterales bacterium]|nr:hypothetical protein [Solirubrobacterales bacterium]